MSDDSSLVKLGEYEHAEGAPLSQVSSRLSWPNERERIRQQEGNSTIRTLDVPQCVEQILNEIDTSYFPCQREFEQSICTVIGTGRSQLQSIQK